MNTHSVAGSVRRRWLLAVIALPFSIIYGCRDSSNVTDPVRPLPPISRSYDTCDPYNDPGCSLRSPSSQEQGAFQSETGRFLMSSDPLCQALGNQAASYLSSNMVRMYDNITWIGNTMDIATGDYHTMHNLIREDADGNAMNEDAYQQVHVWGDQSTGAQQTTFGHELAHSMGYSDENTAENIAQYCHSF